MQCNTKMEDYNMLRFHSGSLVPQEWSYGITHRWEWDCCNLIVPYYQVKNLDASQGCNFGLCVACRDQTPYRDAIEQRRKEEEKQEWD